MALDIFFKEDLARILRAIKNANDLKDGENLDYDAGFNAALGSVALAVGVVINGEFSDHQER